MDSNLEYMITTTVHKLLQEKKQIKVEVAKEVKDMCWLEESLSEGQIISLKKQNWDVYNRSMARE